MFCFGAGYVNCNIFSGVLCFVFSFLRLSVFRCFESVLRRPRSANVNHCVICQFPITIWLGRYMKIEVNTLRLRQNGHHFAEDIFKHIFFSENVCISIKISLMFVPKGAINNIPALVQIMAWRRPGDKPLSEPMMVNLLMKSLLETYIYLHFFPYLDTGMAQIIEIWFFPPGLNIFHCHTARGK